MWRQDRRTGNPLPSRSSSNRRGANQHQRNPNPGSRDVNAERQGGRFRDPRAKSRDVSPRRPDARLGPRDAPRRSPGSDTGGLGGEDLTAGSGRENPASKQIPSTRARLGNPNEQNHGAGVAQRSPRSLDPLPAYWEPDPKIPIENRSLQDSRPIYPGTAQKYRDPSPTYPGMNSQYQNLSGPKPTDLIAKPYGTTFNTTNRVPNGGFDPPNGAPKFGNASPLENGIKPAGTNTKTPFKNLKSPKSPKSPKAPGGGHRFFNVRALKSFVRKPKASVDSTVNTVSTTSKTEDETPRGRRLPVERSPIKDRPRRPKHEKHFGTFPWEFIKTKSNNHDTLRKKRTWPRILIGVLCVAGVVALIVIIALASRKRKRPMKKVDDLDDLPVPRPSPTEFANWCPRYRVEEAGTATLVVKQDFTFLQPYLRHKTLHVRSIAIIEFNVTMPYNRSLWNSSPFVAFIVPMKTASMAYVLDFHSRTVKRMALPINSMFFSSKIAKRMPFTPTGKSFMGVGEEGLIGVRFDINYRERNLQFWVCRLSQARKTEKCTVNERIQLQLKMGKGLTNPIIYIADGMLPLDPSKKPNEVIAEAEFILLRESYACELWEEQIEGSFIQKCRSATKGRLRTCTFGLRTSQSKTKPPQD